MYISVLKMKIRIPLSESLKEKRMVKNKIKDRVENTFRSLVNETDTQENKKILSLGVVYSSSSQSNAEQQINSILEYIEKNFDYEIYDLEKYVEKF
ncbi:MAG: DUF503 domain-containing protein [Sebaldella sp.]|nr:DUF503 domain-containing protein [Sebaldella sp.]